MKNDFHFQYNGNIVRLRCPICKHMVKKEEWTPPCPKCKAFRLAEKVFVRKATEEEARTDEVSK